MANFMTAKTEIGGLLETREQLLEKTAVFIADAIIDRASDKGVNNSTIRDVEDIITPFSPNERQVILQYALIKVASNGKFAHSSNGKKKNDDDNYYQNLLFGNRKRK